MLEWLTKWKPVFEIIYFVAGIGLAATVIIGLQQIKLLKKDMSDRNKRAAVEKSIEYLNWFATEFIPANEVYQDNLTKDQVINHQGPFNDFVFTPDFNVHIPAVSNSLIKFKEYQGLSLANQLEFFAAALRSGLADEELVFNPLADLYCQSVEMLYVGYCNHRKNSDSRLFTNTLQLYKMWRGRLNRLKEEQEKKNHDASSKVDLERIKSIGL